MQGVGRSENETIIGVNEMIMRNEKKQKKQKQLILAFLTMSVSRAGPHSRQLRKVSYL